MAELKTQYCGVELKNPLICASAPPTHTPEACRRAAEAGFAAVVLKTHGVELPDSLLKTVGRPTYAMADWRGINRWQPKAPKKSMSRKYGRKGKVETPYTMISISPGVILSYFVGDKYVDYVNKTKDLVSDDCLVIASIVAITERGWEEQCNLIRKTNADMVELNFGCPHTFAEGKEPEDFSEEPLLGSMPDLIEKYTTFCIDRLDIPVISKIQPEGVSLLALAKICQEAGAMAINFSDSSFLHALRIDIEEETVGWSRDYPSFSTFWGPWVTPYICGKLVHFRKNGIKIDLSASGGVSSGADVIRLMMAGATTVQAARSIMVEGWDVVHEWLDFMNEWMERKGYRSLKEIYGSAVDKVITDYSKLPLYVPQIMGGPEPDKKMVVNAEKCIGCGWCEACCSHLAIRLSNDIPEFDYKRCEVCGLCEGVCPVGAIKMVDK